MDTLGNLRAVRRALEEKAGGPGRTGRTGRHSLPAAWTIDRRSAGGTPDGEDPHRLYGRAVDALLDSPPAPRAADGAGPGAWSRGAVVYNMMIRLSAAHDHDGDGTLGLPANGSGWRETGSFLKALLLLPWISLLGCNTVHLLPVQEIGEDGRRGALGSPYAVRDLLRPDPMLGEPNTGLPVEVQFAAFVEAAHHLGIRVVLELPLRTMSKDCLWAKDYPEWFYWIPRESEFHPPAFTRAEISLAGGMIERGEMRGLPEPGPAYRSLFADPPAPETVRRIDGRWVGRSPQGVELVIPGAFADWPPDDHQPVWNDVTYLKFHQTKRFNYPSYNTVRMYDERLLEEGSENHPLWTRLASSVVRLAADYRLDGLMVDMAHAIPPPLIESIVGGVRSSNPGFALWAEDFSRNEKQARAGFDAVLGAQWSCQHRPREFREMIDWLGRTPGLPPQFAAPETHNTPRAAARPGGDRYARYAWAVSCFLPSIPFLHSGLELNETRPVNTGLDFTPDELKRFPAGELPLFSAHRLPWDGVGAPPAWIVRPLEIREGFGELLWPGPAARCELLSGSGPEVITFVRSSAVSAEAAAIAANSDVSAPAEFTIAPVDGRRWHPADLLSEVECSAMSDGGVRGTLPPGGVAVFRREGG